MFKQIASDITASRRLRIAAVHALESIAGPDYSPSLALDADGRPDLELRAKTIVNWLEENGPPGDCAEIDRAGAQIGHCIDEMSRQMRDSRSLEGHAFEPEFNCIQAGIGLLDAAADSGKAAQCLVERLARLHSLPSSNPADELDRSIGLLQYQVLRALENHGGPIRGLEREHRERADVEPLVAELLTWWAAAKERSPTEWRMQRLGDRGFRISRSEPGPSIGAELVRAVRSGSPADAFAASAVLKSLDLCNGTVPVRGDDVRSDSALADTRIRGLVASEAAGRMFRGQFPVWDAGSKMWGVKQGDP
jgi:hypothetical protein